MARTLKREAGRGLTSRRLEEVTSNLFRLLPGVLPCSLGLRALVA